MFGLEFLTPALLLALPLAGLPVLLHLLFRRKSPLVPFSTLRFIKASMQRSAARKRVQRWLLLACRILLLAILILAVAQPARRLTGGWLGGGAATSAAIVVDTSYSMLLQDQQSTLLQRANDTVSDLLADDSLKNARVAVFRSDPAGADNPEKLESPAAIQENWRPLEAQPAIAPLADRIDAAVQLLNKDPADRKWLIVITDLQSREFPHSIPDFSGKTILIDLHPEKPHAAGISRIAADPPQPRLGIPCQAVVEIVGHATDPQDVALQVSAPDAPDTLLDEPTLPMANLSDKGVVAVRAPITFKNQSWLLLKASIRSPDDLPWAATRSQLIRIPPAAITALVPVPRPNRQAENIIRIALDPSEGHQPAWPISLRPPGMLRGDEQVLVAALTEWPDIATAHRLAEFTRRGGTLVLFFQPGMEDYWPGLPSAQRAALLPILPGVPAPSMQAGPFRASIARPDDPLFAEAAEAQSASGGLMIARLVPFAVEDPSITTILTAAPDNPSPGSKPSALLYRCPVGSGQVYAWATLPSPLYGNLDTYELFLPMLVNSSLRPQAESQALNIEIGHQIVIPAGQIAGQGALFLQPPQGVPVEFDYLDDSDGRRYVSKDPINQPGLYAWMRGDQVVGWTNVQPPAGEMFLNYRPATEVATPGPDVLIARSLTELRSRMNQVDQPDPRWPLLIAIVMFLLCLEALMGSLSKLWKPILPRFFAPVA